MRRDEAKKIFSDITHKEGTCTACGALVELVFFAVELFAFAARNDISDRHLLTHRTLRLTCGKVIWFGIYYKMQMASRIEYTTNIIE